MSTELAQSQKPDPQSGRPARKHNAPGRLHIFIAQLILYWERLAPAMLPGLGVVMAFAIAGLTGAFTGTPAWLHWATLALGFGALCVTLWRDLGPVRAPTRREAQQRLEKDSALVHAPLQSLDDQPSDPALSDNPLWRAHMAASLERAKAVRLRGPRDTITARDPYGLRFMALGLLAISVISAGQNWKDRLTAMLDPGAGAPGSLLADLWIEPPDYTGKAPVYLMRAGEEKSGLLDQLIVPQGANVILQVNGRGRRALSFTTGTEHLRATINGDNSAARGEINLAESGVLTLRLGRNTARWPIGVRADDAPLVAWDKEPEADDKNLIAFSYIAEDDYGLASARLEMRLDPEQPRPLDFPDLGGDALGAVRSVPLGENLPASGVRSALIDLQADPWAGLTVLARIVVIDANEQTGSSEDALLTLPSREFFNPLARVVLEQRQNLAVAPGNWRRTARSFDAVTMAPEAFFDRPTDYLLMRSAFWRVMRQDGEGFDDAVKKFWPLALQLEDHALELARQRLEAAEEALREAIERGASDEEIARLTEELRQAMNDYLEALAQSGQVSEQAGGGQGEQIDRSNLDDMLDAVRDLAQSGAGNAARQMLSELENLLNNLQLQRGGGGSGSGGPSAPGQSGQAGDAADLIGRQRELADDAFQRGQNGEGGNADDLARAQEGLGRDLDELIDGLSNEGREADPDGEAGRALGRARDEMRDAEDALRMGDLDAAGSAMERAIAQMREGAEGLAREQMRQANEGRDGERGRANADPLGRPSGAAYGEGVEVPEESEAARTRAIIDRLRDRLGEPGRSDEEIEYLERLLERF